MKRPPYAKRIPYAISFLYLPFIMAINHDKYERIGNHYLYTTTFSTSICPAPIDTVVLFLYYCHLLFLCNIGDLNRNNPPLSVLYPFVSKPYHISLRALYVRE